MSSTASGESMDSTTFSEWGEPTVDDYTSSDIERSTIESKEIVEDDEDWSNVTSCSIHTAIEKGIPRRKENEIEPDCSQVSLAEVCLAFGLKEKEKPKPGNLFPLKDKKEQKMTKNGEIPSMWDYDPNCLAKEFVDLDANTFLMDPSKKSICFVTNKILARICAMLIPLDFVNLSQACRFLYWKMFTFCTCYAPNRVRMFIDDCPLVDGVRNEWTWTWSMPSIVYFDCAEHGPISSIDYFQYKYFAAGEGYRGTIIQQPACLRKPFIFEILEVYLILPHFEKQDYDRCLPSIMAVRQFTTFLRLGPVINFCPRENFSLPATEEFIKTVKPDAYYIETYDNWGEHHIFLSCPSVQQIYELSVDFDHRKIDIPFLKNTIGIYGRPSNEVVERTLDEFFYGSTKLDFHAYCDLEIDGNGRFPLLEDLFNRYKFDDNEYYSDQFWHVWYVTVNKNGRRFKMRISKRLNYDVPQAGLMIGKEEIFQKKEAECDPHTYGLVYTPGIYDWDRERRKDGWWKMETAVEPEGKAQGEDRSVDEEEKHEENGLVDEEEEDEKHGEGGSVGENIIKAY